MTTTRGDFAGADAVLGRAARLFAELGDPVGRAWLRGTTAFARLLAGRLHEARRLARVFLPFGERVGEAWAVGTLRAVEAFAAAELGDLAEADREARRAYRDFAARRRRLGPRASRWSCAGVVARGLGEPDARRRPAHRRAAGTASGPATRCCSAWPARCAASSRWTAATPSAAEADARAVLTAVEPHDVLDAGPGRAAGAARPRPGWPPATRRPRSGCSRRSPATPDAPSLLFSRRQALAVVRVRAARRRPRGRRRWPGPGGRVEAPAEDVRSRVVAALVLAGALAACGGGRRRWPARTRRSGWRTRPQQTQ